MSHVSGIIGPKGPLLTVTVGVSAPRATALRTAGRAVPLAVTANLLIDTGASETCLDLRFIRQLELYPTGSVTVHTPSTGDTGTIMDAYDVGLAVHGIGSAMHTLSVHSVLACDFGKQGIDGLLGRDILGAARLTYSGPDNSVYLSF